MILPSDLPKRMSHPLSPHPTRILICRGDPPGRNLGRSRSAKITNVVAEGHKSAVPCESRPSSCSYSSSPKQGGWAFYDAVARCCRGDSSGPIIAISGAEPKLAHPQSAPASPLQPAFRLRWRRGDASCNTSASRSRPEAPGSLPHPSIVISGPESQLVARRGPFPQTPVPRWGKGKPFAVSHDLLGKSRCRPKDAARTVYFEGRSACGDTTSTFASSVCLIPVLVRFLNSERHTS